jgi:hypothetical protein
MTFLKISAVLLSFLIFQSCGSQTNSPEDFAKKFCSCSEELSMAVVKLKNQKISLKEFEIAKNEQINCMGPNDPRQSLSPAEVDKFDAAFYKALFEKCPNTARNYGFKE